MYSAVLNWYRRSTKKALPGKEWTMPTVLIIDVDDAIRKVLHTIFNRGSGFDTCMEAGNGADAIVKATQLMPDLAVLDCPMPQINGLQLARRLKTIAPELPIFMLTAAYDAVMEKEALSWGITAVFSKLDDLATLAPNARAVCGIGW
jgi:CheY-like chemotaxis protein